MAANDGKAVSGKVLSFSPTRNGKRIKRGPRAKYYYPREALEQDYFTLNSYGKRLNSGVHMSMLASEKFESQIALLLSQLSNEGYDVSGPEAEFRAMREIIQSLDNELDDLFFGITRLRRKWTSPAIEYEEQRTGK